MYYQPNLVTHPTSDIGSGGKLINLTPDFSGSAVTGYGIYQAATDSTANANTNYGYYSSLALTGNAAKSGIGIYSTVTSSSTTADTLTPLDLATSATGAISSGTRTIYGLRSQPVSTAASSGTQTLNLYASYLAPSSTLATAGTTNVYGEYITTTATHAADAGTINQYGLYIANGTSSTSGTATKYGLYVESPTGADNNYAAVFAGGNVGIGTTGPTALLNLKGTLSSALTGTVAVTNLSTTVTGTGTAFNTELAVGDSIKIGTEIFTVSAIASATSLTLDSAYQGSTASGLTAYRDPTLFAIDNGDAVNKLTITRSGNVGIGTTGPGAKLDVRGNVQIPDAGTNLSFGSNLGQMLNLYSSTYGIGIQDSTLYFRGNADFQFYKQGTHSNTRGDPGTGGVALMTIKDTGKVGIGTISPYEWLEVTGGTRIGQAPATYTTVTDNPLSSSATTVNVVSTTGYPSAGTLLIDSEAMTYTGTTATSFTGVTRAALGTTAASHNQGATVKNYLFTALATATTPKMVITGEGNVGIGTTSPARKLEIRSTTNNDEFLRLTGDAGDYYSLRETAGNEFQIESSTYINFDAYRDGVDATLTSTAAIFYDSVGIGTTPSSKLTITETGDFAFGDFNAVLIDDMEATFDWTESDNTNTSATDESTNVKTGSGAMKITTVAGSSNNDTVKKTFGSSQGWQNYERISFWIKASQTGQIISFQFSEDDVTYQDHDITISEANQWQYQEWDISGITSTSRDAVLYTRFIIDSDTSSPTFYIDQARVYDSDERTSEMYVDKDGNLVVWSKTGVEIGRGAPGSSLPSMKIGAANVEIRSPLDLQVEGDVGIEYNLTFLNNGISYLASAGPLIISAGDSNSYENLTITTGGTGDVIIDIADSTNGFRIVGTTAGVFSIDKNGNVVIGGVNAVDADLTVKRNIATQGGNITIAKLSVPTTLTCVKVGSHTAGATTYEFKVTALNGNGETTPSAECQTTAALAALDASNYIQLTWDAVSGATKYRVYACVNASCTETLDNDTEPHAASPTTYYNVDDSTFGATALPTANTTGGDITGILSFSDVGTALTVSSNAITITQTYHRIDNCSAAQTVNTINGGSAGDILVLRPSCDQGAGLYTITFTDAGASPGANALSLAGAATMDDADDTIVLIYNGTYWLEVTRSTGNVDIAESYYTDDLSIEAGDVVAVTKLNESVLSEKERLRQHKYPAVRKTDKSYDSGLVGVISTAPYVTLGGGYDKLSSGAETRPLALSGRVPVKVSLENGNIAVGDWLTSSSQPGVAMKTTKSGQVIGKALESFEGKITECTVTFVKPTPTENSSLSDENTLQLTNCQERESEIGKIIVMINVGWQNMGSSDNIEWLELKDRVTGEIYCVGLENGDWQKVKKTTLTCEESATETRSPSTESGSPLAPSPESSPTPELTPSPEPAPEPTPHPSPAATEGAATPLPTPTPGPET